MDNIILTGCDLHDKNMLTETALGKDAPAKRSFANDAPGRTALIVYLRKCASLAGGARIVFAYEASGLGFGLRDELTAAGIVCHVLAPSKIARSSKQLRNKTDEKDALQILEILRGHYLAGNELPAVWVPDKQTRDDRELVRCRLDVQEKSSSTKTQIVTLLKRNGVSKADAPGNNWTLPYRAWLAKLAGVEKPLNSGARGNLASLLRQLKALEREVEKLDKELAKLIRTERYAAPAARLMEIKAVGVLTALVFLTEMGEMSRFENRREVGAYLGLAPSAHESGETSDKKGHITHQGPARVRFVLNQAVWNILRCDPAERAVYERIAEKNPKHKKIAVVAAMRRLAVKMWHVAGTKKQAS
jgi:transposase